MFLLGYILILKISYHYFVRKFMVYVIIDCFTGFWTVFAFPSHAAFVVRATDAN